MPIRWHRQRSVFHAPQEGCQKNTTQNYPQGWKSCACNKNILWSSISDPEQHGTTKCWAMTIGFNSTMIELNVTDIASGIFFVISIVLMDKLLSHQLGNSEFRTGKIDGQENHINYVINYLLTKKNVHQQSFLGGGFNYFSIFTPTWGRFPIWRLFCQMGWFNHQPLFLFQESELSVTSSPGEKEILRWGCLHDAQGDLDPRICVGVLHAVFPVMGWNCGVFFQTKKLFSLNMYVYQYTSSILHPKKRRKRVF